MKQEQRLLSQEEAAIAAAIELTTLRLHAASGLIAPEAGYSEADLAELRRIRRLHEHLGLDHSAVDVVVRMRRRLLALQDEVKRLETELRLLRRTLPTRPWVDADWMDVP